MPPTAADEAYERAVKLVTAATGPASTPEARRALVEQLIELPTYASERCKSLFGTYIHKYFAQFPDLQDRAVDVILDLCEDDDEKTRIVGIKGLGTTAKAEPRWVRGNAGVLLQLLECPPRELKYVRDALYTLMAVDPAEVFGIMADDCKGSEDETGASRRNILDFLEQSVQQRADILASGNNVEAEHVFRDGFISALPTCALAETRQVLALLLPLSTISGRNATEERATDFCKRLTASLHHGSPQALAAPFVRLFADLTQRTGLVDARAALAFLAAHGSAVVGMAMDADDVGRTVIERLKGWVPGVIDAWRSSRKGDTDLTEAKVLPQFCSTILGAFLISWAKPRTQTNLAPTVEIVLYSVYSLLLSKDRRTYVKPTDARALSEFAREALQLSRSTQRHSTSSRTWLNVHEMAKILGDDRQKAIKIFPSWEPEPLAPAKMSPPRGRPSLPPTGPRSDRERPPPAGPSRPPQRPAPPSGPSSARPNQPNGAPAAVKPSPTSPKIPRTSFPEETLVPRSAQKPVQSDTLIPPSTEPPTTPSLLMRISASAQQPQEPGRIESIGDHPTANGGRPLTTPAQPVPIPNSSSTGPSRPTSLADRIGMRTASGSAKRPREDPLPPSAQNVSPSTGPSLLSRLGGQADASTGNGPAADEARGSKRPRESPKSTLDTPQPGGDNRRSLLDRLGNGTPSRVPPGTSTTPSQTFSIMGRSSSQSSLPPASSTPATTTPFNIRTTAPASSSGLSIRSTRSVIHPSIIQTELLPSTLQHDMAIDNDVDDDQGVVRKGRGFEAKPAEEVFDFVLPQRSAEVDMDVQKTAGWGGQAQPQGVGRTQIVRPGKARRRSPQKR